ncbi:MAG: BlaI/MecI/CopY family transcriptional regulator [Solirubrobacteraceae bacterium]
MADGGIQGALQEQIMLALWRGGEGTVDEVRGRIAGGQRSAYTTVQTVLNRLAERGLVSRSQRGRAILYAPTLSESDYVARTLVRTLDGASSEARRSALVELLGGIEEAELGQLRAQAREITKRREDAGS